MGQPQCTCICSSHKAEEEDLLTSARKTKHGPRHALKIRPLLCDLEEEFAKSANRNGTIDAKQLGIIWERCAEKKVGQLSTEDREVIRESAQEYLAVIDLDASGSIDGSEFFAFMLGGLDARGPFREMRESLKVKIASDPRALKSMMEDFKHWDANGDGAITREELKSKMADMKNSGSPEKRGDDTAFIETLLSAMDVDKDGKIDLWEFIAYSLGRRKAPVELLLYDISHGLSQRWSTLLLGRSFEAIYHTSTLVHGQEFWYGGQLFMNEPPMSKVFGQPLAQSDRIQLQQSSYKAELKSYQVGFTLHTTNEIMQFLSGDINSRYTAANYDVLTHNCNCFSNEFVHFLSGDGIPDAVRKLPELVMQTPTARLLRPLLNRWLGGFSHADVHTNPAEHHDFKAAHENSVKEASVDVVCDGFLEAQGGVVSVDLGLIDGDESSGEIQFAQVSRAGTDTLDIKYFDPESCAFVEKKDVPKSLCQPVSIDEHKDEIRSLAVVSAIHSASTSEFEEDRQLQKHTMKEAKGIVKQVEKKVHDKVTEKKADLSKMMHHHGHLTRAPSKKDIGDKKGKKV
eukprot:gnl/MRDRNA2_/MRDRNA2_103077_c0_seq1.p1 gnl/MRDRNA2_/MRDRNA2_103077_c0~~gnl/MRDRNA2_/MRDRNA2_103077_c0_seq1.p1  ORF type:complete len:571 (-),score=120.23 gnl/MRDRNA2_/MRDRNA2_103077_c0_seq1:97-1809(-)